MPKNTSVTLEEHFETFITIQIFKLTTLRKALQDGEKSGLVEYSLSALLEELDQEKYS